MFPNYYIYTSNHPSFDARGVAVFINSRLDFGLINCIADQQGNILTLHCTINGKQMAIIGFYGPRGDNTWFYSCLQTAIKDARIICDDIIVMGDFNLFFNLHLDANKYDGITKTKGIRILKQAMREADLVDIYRQKYPKGNQISWRKWNTTKGARLDFCLLHEPLTEFITEVEYLPPPHWLH